MLNCFTYIVFIVPKKLYEIDQYCHILIATEGMADSTALVFLRPSSQSTDEMLCQLEEIGNIILGTMACEGANVQNQSNTK